MGSAYAVRNLVDSDNMVPLNNYWGNPNPDPDILFSTPGNVDFSGPYLTSPFEPAGAPEEPEKMAIIAEKSPFEKAYLLELSGDYSGALANYKKILEFSNDQSMRKKIIKSIFRINQCYNHDFTELRNIINNELSSDLPKYKSVYDFILCDILVREGRYEEAITAFAKKSEKYKGTSIEVDMLARIATIYGYCLNNKKMAKEYADMAASINPGQDCLIFAYQAAGIDYNLKDIDKPADEEEPLPENQPDFEEIQEFVTVSPNPSNPITTITYSIKNPSHVKCVIYSITGQKVATLVDKHMSAGSHSVKFDGSDLGSGVYLYRLESKGFTKTGKMLFLK